MYLRFGRPAWQSDLGRGRLRTAEGAAGSGGGQGGLERSRRVRLLLDKGMFMHQVNPSQYTQLQAGEEGVSNLLPLAQNATLSLPSPPNKTPTMPDSRGKQPGLTLSQAITASEHRITSFLLQFRCFSQRMHYEYASLTSDSSLVPFGSVCKDAFMIP